MLVEIQTGRFKYVKNLRFDRL